MSTLPQFRTQPNSVTRPDTFNEDSDNYHEDLPGIIEWMEDTRDTMAAVAAGGAYSLQYTFSTTTTDADPGAGILRLDNATQNTATTIRADLLGRDTSDYSGVLALLDDSTSTNKGYLKLLHAEDSTKWLLFSVASIASPSGYKNITVTCVGSSSANPFADGDDIFFDFTPTGDKGDTGATASNIPPGSEKTSAYTLQASDAGGYIPIGTGGSIEVPDGVFAQGDCVSLFNNTSSGKTITCTITTAYISGTDSDKASVTLAARGICSILFHSGTVCVIGGSVS